jgi:hypothetical protein
MSFILKDFGLIFRNKFIVKVEVNLGTFMTFIQVISNNI